MPLSASEISKVKASEVRALPGQYESNGAVLGTLQNMVVYHRPDDYVQTYKYRVERQRDKDVEAAAKQVIRPKGLTWVVIGDRKQIEQPLRALNIGKFRVLDTEDHASSAAGAAK